MPPATAPESQSIRLLALDVDGTLLTSRHRIQGSTITAVQAASALGMEIVLASARSPRSLRPLLAALKCGSYVIAYSGALVCRLDADPEAELDLIAEARLPLESAQQIVAQALSQGISLGWFEGETWYISAWDENLRREAEIIAMPPLLLPDLSQRTSAPHKLQCMVAEHNEFGKLEGLRDLLPPGCVGLYSHPNYLEIIPAEADKARALAQLGETLGISLDEIAAIGDGENDLGMLQAVGFGVAMGNAPVYVRQAARWVTASNDMHGVAIAVERILANTKGQQGRLF